MQPASTTMPRPALNPDLVIFDLDDTLCDYAGARTVRLRIAIGNALQLADAAIDAEELEALIAASIATHPHGVDHFPALLAPHGVEPAHVGMAQQWYRRNRFHSLALFEDAIDAVREVREGKPGRTIGMITNGPTEVQRAKIALLGVESLMDFILISEEFGAAKPEPAIFHEALAIAGVDASRAVMVGDSPEFDIAGATAAGIRAIWLNRTHGAWPPELNRPGAPIWDVASLAEAVEVIGR